MSPSVLPGHEPDQLAGASPPLPAVATESLGWRLLRAVHWSAPLWALSPLAAAAWFVQRFNPTDRLADPTGPCLWHLMTGLNGPTCGGTRMFFYLIHGNLIEAARFHLPALLAVPVVGYLWLRWLFGRVGLHLPMLRLPRWALIGYAVFFLIFSAVLRNIDWGLLGWFDIPNLATRI